MAAKHDERGPTGSGWTLVVAAAVSVVWLGATLYLGWNARPCELPNESFVSCLSRNEWGDFLAGVFDPLAFVWLLAIVWVQSTGLREQRNLLALTRREIADNRAAIQTQADETRNQAKFIGEQTEVLKEERAAAAAERVFEAYVAQLTLWLRHYPQAFEVRSAGNKLALAVVPDLESDGQLIAATVASLRTEVRSLESKLGPSPTLEASYPHDLQRIFESVASCWRAGLQLPPASRIRAESMELTEFYRWTHAIRPLVANYPEQPAAFSLL